MATASHDPVMVDQVVDLLAVAGARRGVVVDCTLGAAGHATRILAASGENVHLVGFDRDESALELAGNRLAAWRDRSTLVHAPFDEFAQHVEPVLEAHGPLLGVLYDLGVSSMQLDTPGRGFSFRSFGPLDMRMDQSSPTTAASIVNGAEVEDLERILRTYGEEAHAGRIAAAIVAARPFTSTLSFADLVAEAMPRAQRRRDRAKGIHPATRTFQALRIAVNTELERFEASLPQALELLASPAPDASPGDMTEMHRHGADVRGGRIVTLAYHSLEDRIAKRFFSDAADGCICPPDLPVCGCGRVPSVRPLTRKAQRPTPAEVERNPRARSAILRAVERLPVTDQNPDR